MAAKDEAVRRLREQLGEGALREDVEFRSGVSWTISCTPESLLSVMKIFNACGFYLESLTGLDFQDTLELVYHMNTYEPRARMAVRVLCPHDGEVPSVTGIFDSALWQEREAWEFFGVSFRGHPDLRRLLLPEDADYYPLRKDFGTVHAYRKREEVYG
ncbi:NADH-quinone oxidoreductase subunit C [Desulfosoma caldarium]|uniref:NADH-quinone oxidoreductase n=1 Tax=Desulfosoma caldarium TaxID=610254 RepID=A0A3N1UQW1_9BACT|nr:NADH-quinone oxidoreductase subunit C [Desulfosoma caldarium]ROQ93485.1 NADH-quinone oxidoreductase subunit C [Desulfosoma caldarium]